MNIVPVYNFLMGAVLALLYTGKCTYKRCSIGSIFTPNLQGSFLATENFFHTSKVYNPFNFMLVDAKIPSECEENCLNIGL